MLRKTCAALVALFVIPCFAETPQLQKPCPAASVVKGEAGVLRCDLENPVASEVSSRLNIAGLPKLTFQPIGTKILLISWQTDTPSQAVLDSARELIRSLDRSDTAGSQSPCPPLIKDSGFLRCELGHPIAAGVSGMMSGLSVFSSSKLTFSAVGDKTIAVSWPADASAKTLDFARDLIRKLDQPVAAAAQRPCPSPAVKSGEAGAIRCDLTNSVAVEVSRTLTASTLPTVAFIPVSDRIILLRWTDKADPRIVETARALIGTLDLPPSASSNKPCPPAALNGEAAIVSCKLENTTASDMSATIAAMNPTPFPNINFTVAGKKLLLVSWTAATEPRSVYAALDLIAKLDEQKARENRPLTEGHVIQLFNNRDGAAVVSALGLNSTSTPKAGAIGDMIVISPDKDDDAKVADYKRQIAFLDQTRPQIAMNVWSIRLTSKNPELVETEAEGVRRLVSSYNDSLVRALQQGWEYLNGQIGRGEDLFADSPNSYFDEGFYRYISLRYIAPFGGPGPAAADANLDVLNKELNACKPDRYCLGFRPFSPLRPTLANMMVALAAAKKPQEQTNFFVNRLESCKEPMCFSDPNENQTQTCVERDSSASDNAESPQPHFSCLRDQLKRTLNPLPAVNSSLGILRASLADFLFNYKQANQYSHDFIPYDLTQSAQNLDAALDPVLVAFNRDVQTFLERLQSKVNNLAEGSKVKYYSNGMISVRAISGTQAKVDTRTANYFDATEPPTLSSLLTELKNADNSMGSVIKDNLSAHAGEVLTAALNVVKPVTAKMGDKSHLEITPWSLAGAGGAELKVKFSNGEDSAPQTGDTASGFTKEDTNSRVAEHDVETNVRVESLKLFELSSFSATLRRGRKNFPIILPLFELPYIGSLVSLPRKPDANYHRSFIIVSAIIAPTAADIANSIDYSGDRFLKESGNLCTTASKGTKACHPELGHFYRSQDLPHEVRSFHKAFYRCLLAGGNKLVGGEDIDCADLTFDKVAESPHDNAKAPGGGK